MSDIKNLVINNESYNIVDDEAVHFTSQSLTDTEKELARTNINAAKPITYSTEEVLTGDTWIDGKKIYRKIITFTGSGSNGQHLTLEPFSGAITNVISFHGGVINADNNFYPIPLLNYNSIQYQIYIYISEINTSSPVIHIRCGSSRSMNSGWIMVEYTK